MITPSVATGRKDSVSQTPAYPRSLGGQQTHVQTAENRVASTRTMFILAVAICPAAKRQQTALIRCWSKSAAVFHRSEALEY